MIWKSENKYKAKKIEDGGETFDSRKEYKRWKELVLLERAGEITNLRRQVKYVLIPTQREPPTTNSRGNLKPGKIIERECSYIADFVYTDVWTGKEVIEDVKGYKGGGAYRVFQIKRKLMLFHLGKRVTEV